MIGKSDCFLLIQIYVFMLIYSINVQTFLLGSIKRILVKLMSLSLRVHLKSYDIFSFFYVWSFVQFFSMVSWSIELIEERRFWWLDPSVKDNWVPIAWLRRSPGGWILTKVISYLWRLVWVWHLILVLSMNESLYV